jgi:hypothetical protein
MALPLVVDDITREPIESSNLESLGYDPVRRQLAIAFKSGALFHYADVDPDTAAALYCADSRGAFFSQNIKGKFPGRKMTGPCGVCRDQGVIGTACACGEGQHYAEEKRDLGRPS